jgi:transcriptional regulator with XRE-family HTH domain
MQLYEQIKVLRKVRNLTQSQFAEKLDVSRQAVQKWESGISSPDITKLTEIASLFGVTVDILLDVALTEEELLYEILNRQKQEAAAEAKRELQAESLKVAEVAKAQEPQKKQRSMPDWLILVPVLLGVCIGIFMFYVFGAMAIGFGFLFSAGGIISGVWSVVAIFMNASGGAGAILICVGGIFLGFGATAPLFWVSRWWLKKYRALAGQLANKIKKFDIRSI